MAETHEETPKKTNARSSVCRLCGGCYESHCMCRILNKTDVCVKIKEICKINVTKDDNLSKMMCKNCKKFVIKLCAFVEKCQKMQVGIEQCCSVKRCVDLSSSVTIPPSKRLSVSAHQQPCFVKKTLFLCKTTSTPSKSTQASTNELILNKGEIEKII